MGFSVGSFHSPYFVPDTFVNADSRQRFGLLYWLGDRSPGEHGCVYSRIRAHDGEANINVYDVSFLASYILLCPPRSRIFIENRDS